jgi:Phytanoyl-CoA dioxygenase (PhyH)
MYPYETNKSTLPWFEGADANQHLQSLLNENEINMQEYEHLSHFIEKGFIEIEGLIDESLIDAVNGEIDDAIEKGYQGYERGSSQRMELLHNHYPSMRKLWLDKRHRRMVDLIFGVPGRPTQTLTFVCGSQQPPHSDLVYLTPFPAGYMCGTWIALQDVVEGSGELVVYPGSHREPRIYLKDTGCEKVVGGSQNFNERIYSRWSEISSKYKPIIYRPKKGSILIWHENLLHGGSTRLDQSLERRSVVIHSFADGACVYYDATGSVGHVAPLSVLNE